MLASHQLLPLSIVYHGPSNLRRGHIAIPKCEERYSRCVCTPHILLSSTAVAPTRQAATTHSMTKLGSIAQYQHAWWYPDTGTSCSETSVKAVSHPSGRALLQAERLCTCPAYAARHATAAEVLHCTGHQVSHHRCNWDSFPSVPS